VQTENEYILEDQMNVRVPCARQYKNPQQADGSDPIKHCHNDHYSNDTLQLHYKILLTEETQYIVNFTT